MITTERNIMKRRPIMNTRALILSCALLLTTPLFARESTDVIFMKNGDRLTGEIKGLNAGVLYMSMGYLLGTSSVQWSKVARLKSKQLFLVKTEDGSVYTGTLTTTNTPASRPVEIAVAPTSGKEAVIDSSRIVQMYVTSTKPLQRLNGYINTGIIYSKGNQSTQYSLGSQVTYPRERWAAGGSFNSTLSASTGVSASTRNQLDIDAYHLLPWDNWFYEGLGGLLQSSEQGIVHQAFFGGGVGRYLKNTNLTHITVLGGLAGQSTVYQQNINTQNTAFGLISANLQFFRFDKTNGTLAANFLPAINDPGRVKFNVNANYYVKLIGNLSWNASFYGNWDSRPPGGLPSSDYGSSSGFSWTFGNK